MVEKHHKNTISRKLQKLRKNIQKNIEKFLVFLAMMSKNNVSKNGVLQYFLLLRLHKRLSNPWPVARLFLGMAVGIFAMCVDLMCTSLKENNILAKLNNEMTALKSSFVSGVSKLQLLAAPLRKGISEFFKWIKPITITSLEKISLLPQTPLLPLPLSPPLQKPLQIPTPISINKQIQLSTVDTGSTNKQIQLPTTNAKSMVMANQQLNAHLTPPLTPRFAVAAQCGTAFFRLGSSVKPHSGSQKFREIELDDLSSILKG